MKIEVEIISNENIKPSIPTDHHLKTFKLSSLDWHRPPAYIPLILFYTTIDQTDQVINGENIHIISDRLRKSLSDTLTRFYPIAGRIKDNNTWVDCSDQGVEYIETRINGKVSDFTMTSELLHQLVPVHKNLPTQVPAIIQVNFFRSGGVAIAVCISHKIGDTSTYATFINSWAATVRGASADCPSFDSQSLFPIVVPDVRDTDQKEHSSSDEHGNENLVSKRLVFDGEKVTALRERIGGTFKYPTRVQAVSSLLWKSAVEADIATSPPPPPSPEDQKSEPVSEMHIIVNLRKRIDPPLADSSFGNIFSMATAKASVTRGAIDLNDLAGRIRDATSRIDSHHVKRMQNDEDSKEEYHRFNIGVSRMDGEHSDYWLMSWCNFPLYEIDFGFGKPNWVTTDAVEVLEENDIYLIDTSTGNGVEAWIKLEQEKMNMFSCNQELLEFATIFD